MSDGSTKKLEQVVIEQAPEPPVRPMVDGPAHGNPRQYLEGFLSEKPQAEAPHKPDAVEDIDEDSIDAKLLAALRAIYDPEIPVNIYDLGLIYDCTIDDDHNVEVAMTLTTPNCPVAETMPGEVENRLGLVPGVKSVNVTLVWDPPWDPSKMSDEAKLELGLL